MVSRGEVGKLQLATTLALVLLLSPLSLSCAVDDDDDDHDDVLAVRFEDVE